MSTATASPPVNETPPGTDAPKKTRGKKKPLIALLVLVLAGAGYWFFLKPSGGVEEPVPGEVVVLESIQVNLTDGHYLRLGLAMQLTEGTEEADGSKALDAAIELFSGRDLDEVTRLGQRHKLKIELEETVEERYEGEVMGLYFTEFVTQ